MALRGSKTNDPKKPVSQNDLPRGSLTYPAAQMEVFPTTDGAVLVVHTRELDYGFPMSLEYAEGLIRRFGDVIRQSKAPGLTVVEGGGLIGPGGEKLA